jgi:hypothetical protein
MSWRRQYRQWQWFCCPNFQEAGQSRIDLTEGSHQPAGGSCAAGGSRSTSQSYAAVDSVAAVHRLDAGLAFAVSEGAGVSACEEAGYLFGAAEHGVRGKAGTPGFWAPEMLYYERDGKGRLVLRGWFLPNPIVVVLAAIEAVVVSGSIDWSQSAHRRASAYAEALARLCARADLTSSNFFSVVPIGLAGSPSDNNLKGLQVLRNADAAAPTGAGWAASAPASQPVL